MLTILGRSQNGFCDGVSRRTFLQIGAMGMGGLTLPQLLASEAKAGLGNRSHKATIMIFLPGGPPHQDMWDIKTEAPRDVRGDFDPIPTNVSGIQIGELFPEMAKISDKLVYIRSLVGSEGRHDAFQCLTGHPTRNQPAGGWPSYGAAISRMQGYTDPGIPANLHLVYNTRHQPWGDPGQAGFAGPGHAPFGLVNDQNGKTSAPDSMVLKDMSLDRLRDRKSLLRSFDSFRRDADVFGSMNGMDAFTESAFGILTSSKLLDAMDVSQEDSSIVERYGKGDPVFRADGAPKMTENFLVARRLVEAGARVVTLNFSRWDWHSGNFTRAREDFPMLDRGISALVRDLHERGLDKDVSVVVWGEFGRTPKINEKGGRDHWPKVSCALLAGGGMRTGQVIGATDRLGGEAVDRPVTFPEVHATLYHNMGINPRQSTIEDTSGRPQYMVEQDVQPLRELI